MTAARAVLLGLGGLGCPAALALVEAAARDRRPLSLALVDPDVVEVSNLSRQVLYADADCGRPKVEAAREALLRLVPGAPVALELHRTRFDAATAPALLAGAAVLLDGTDDPATRFFANDAAVRAGVPLVHGAVLGWVGQLLTVLPGRSGCLRCLFEGPPAPGTVPACAQAGVLSPLCGVVGASMAAEAWAVLSGGAPRAAGGLLRWEALQGRTRRVGVPRDPGCVCAA